MPKDSLSNSRRYTASDTLPGRAAKDRCCLASNGMRMDEEDVRVSVCAPASDTDTVCVPASDTIGVPASDKEEVSMKEGLVDK